MHLLWLASWYPDHLSPNNGDFIQRHARAVALSLPFTVIHVVQGDPAQDQDFRATELRVVGNLREWIVQFHYRKTGIRLLDKFRYTRCYRKALFGAIRNYIKANGLPELVHLHIPMKAGMAALWLKRKFGIPYIVSEQSSAYGGGAPDDFHLRSRYYRNKVRELFRKATVVTNVSAAIGEELKKIAGLGQVEVIHNTVDTSHFNPASQAPAKFRIIHVSGLNDQKNINGLLRALTKWSMVRNDWELELVGPIGEELRPAIKVLGERVHLTCTGMLPYEEVAERMKQASVFVLFSDHENFPCVNIEALCCGIPVITSDAGGAREAIHPGNGIVVAIRDEAALVQALDKVRSGYDRYDRAEIAREAHDRYRYAAIGGQFIGLYEKMLRGSFSS
jgi:glycosyltransferase involved in cell wall biosynthesis